jgi:hypothetical protein
MKHYYLSQIAYWLQQALVSAVFFNHILFHCQILLSPSLARSFLQRRVLQSTHVRASTGGSLGTFHMPFGVRGVPSVLMCRCRVISAWRVACPIPDVASAMHALSPARHIPDTAGCARLSWARSSSLSCRSVWRALSPRPLSCHAKAGRVPGLFTDGAYRPCGVDAGAILGRSHSIHSPAKLGDPRHSRAPPVHSFTCHTGGFALVPIRCLLWALLGVLVLRVGACVGDIFGYA